MYYEKDYYFVGLLNPILYCIYKKYKIVDCFDIIIYCIKYVSSNRGIKELDILLGNWAKQNIDGLNENECNELTTILNEETLDLVNYLIKKEKIPNNINNSIMKQILRFKDKGNVTDYQKN